MKRKVQIVLKGMCIGGTMLVPGISGGSMAMILGEYEHLILAVSTFLQNLKKNTIYLCLFSISGILGMVLFANPLLGLIERYPMVMSYFFLGVVAGGVPLICKKAEVTRWTFREGVYILLGICLVLLFRFFPTDLLQGSSGTSGIILLVFAGMIAAVALVLPGISVSYVFLLMGVYEQVMRAISGFQIIILVPLGVGLLLGIFLTTKILELLMTRFPQITYLIILGFVVGSAIEIFPGVPTGMEWMSSIIMLGVGFFVVQVLEKMENSKVHK